MATKQGNGRGCLERAIRLTRLKLVVPLRRSKHPPEYTARGAAIGLFWAFTPLVGIQMYLCLMTWLAFKPFKRLDFSLVVSCAWTWTTNVFTMFPIYYVFYITGQLMRGNWDDISGYGTFLNSWNAAFTADASFWTAFGELIALLAKELGIAMGIGCIPYAIGTGWVGYVLSLKYVEKRRQRRLAKKAAA